MIIIEIWDVSNGKERIAHNNDHPTYAYKDVVQAISFSSNGSQFATAAKDKALRIHDARTQPFITVRIN
jgi:WD40 repeat protein